jgi:hypothetical protein
LTEGRRNVYCPRFSKVVRNLERWSASKRLSISHDIERRARSAGSGVGSEVDMMRKRGVNENDDDLLDDDAEGDDDLEADEDFEDDLDDDGDDEFGDGLDDDDDDEDDDDFEEDEDFDELDDDEGR